MSAERKRGPWFRLSQEETEHIERLMAEADAWEPGNPPPAHSIQEHLAGLRLAMDDIKSREQRLWLHFLLWIFTWALLIGFVVFGSVRLFG